MGTKIVWKQIRSLAKGDGCTSSPDLWFHDACEDHDDDYRFHVDEDGNPLTRLQADNRFLANMRKASPNFLIRNTVPFLYYLAVRLFGWNYWDKDHEQIPLQ